MRVRVCMCTQAPCTTLTQLSLSWLHAHAQILGQLIGGNQAKATQVLGHFRDAASKAWDDAGIWEVLGELRAATDPSGARQHRCYCYCWRCWCPCCCSCPQSCS